MIITKLRKSGNSFIVTVPHEEVKRLQLREGQVVSLEVRPVDIRPALAPDLREAYEVEFPKAEPGLRYLAEH